MRSEPSSGRGRVKKIASLMPGSFTGSGMVSLADQGFTSATSFFTTVIIGRMCSKDELGLYALGFSIIVFLTGLQDAVITTPYTVYIPRLSEHEQKCYKGSVLSLQVGFATFSALILLMALPLSSLRLAPPGLYQILWGLMLASTPVLMREYARRVSFAHLQMKEALRFDLWVGLMQVAGLLSLAFLGGLSAVHALWAVGAACGIASLFWLKRTHRECLFQGGHIRISFKQNWVFGRWLIAANGTSLISNQVCLWFLTIFHGPANTGILSACQGVIFLTNPFFIGIKNLLVPRISHTIACGDANALNRLIAKVTLLLALVMGAFCLLFHFWGEQFVIGFYGAKYEGFGKVISVLAIATFVYALAAPLSFGVSLSGRPDLNFKADLVMLALSLSVGIYLIREFGTIGVAYGLLINNTISLPLRFFLYRRIHGCWKDKKLWD